MAPKKWSSSLATSELPNIPPTSTELTTAQHPRPRRLQCPLSRRIPHLAPRNVSSRLHCSSSARQDLHVLQSCSRGVRITPDIRSLDGIDASSATALVIPGGAPGAKAICGSSQARSLITAFRREGKTVGAICAGTTAIVAAEGEKVKVTSHPSVKEEIVGAGWEYADDTERVVVDGGVVTSRGPGSAIAFALKLVEMLAGKAKADEVRGPMMCAETL